MKTSRLASPANPCGALRHRVFASAFSLGKFRLNIADTALRCLAGFFLSVFPAAAQLVTWSPNPESDIASYQVSYGTSPGVHSVTVDAGLSTSTTVTGLLGGETYYFVVKAVNQAGMISPPSAEVTFLMPPAGPANEAPVASGQTVMTAEDTAVPVMLTASDPENSPLTYTIVGQPSKGVLSGSPPDVTYSPNADVNGTDSFTFRARDGSSNSNTATVSITINPVNDAPAASNKTAVVGEDGTVGITLSGTDKENNPLTYTILGNPTKGTLSGSAPSLTYTPGADKNGADSFTYLVNDGTSNSNMATVSITINPVNDAPVAANKTAITDEDVPVGITLSGTDKESNPLTYTILGNPAKGSLSGNAPNLTYTPGSDKNGPDSFTYRVNDGTLNSNTATVSITINAVNDAPVATAASVSTTEDVAVAIGLRGSDKDADPLTYTIVSGPANGTLSGAAPDLTYLPNAGFLGADAFTFRVNDGSEDSASAIVSVDVVEPTQVVDPALIPQTGWTLAGVDSEDVDDHQAIDAFDGDPDTFWHTRWTSGATPPPHEIRIDMGDVCLVDGFRYLPRQDNFLIGNIADYEFYLSLDGVSWGNPVATGTFANDKTEKEVLVTAAKARFIRLVGLSEANGAMHSAVAELSVIGTIIGNRTPTVEAITATTPVATPVPILLDGEDVDGDALVYTIVRSPVKGSLSGSAPQLVYTPSPGFSGTDSFTYQAGDGISISSVATVSITMTRPNNRPIAKALSITSTQNTPVQITCSGTDADGDTLVYRIVRNPSKGILSGIAPNLIYTPHSGFSGSDLLIYQVTDGETFSVPVAVSITINPGNSLPVAQSGSVATTQGLPVAMVLEANDADGDSLTYAIVSGPSNGRLSGSAPSMTYHPDADFHGSDRITFKVTDGTGQSPVATISIVVRKKADVDSNKTPVFKFSPVTRAAGTENKPYTAASLASTASDPDDGDTLVFSKIAGPDWLRIARNGELSGTPPDDSAGSNRFVILVTDVDGAFDECPLLIDISPSGLPLPWEFDSIGNTGNDGKAAHKAGTFSLSRGGSLNGKRDTAGFMWQTLSGDGQIIARVTGFENGRNTTRAGVMIRDSLGSESRHVFMGVNGDGEYRWMARSRSGKSSLTKTAGSGKSPFTWVRLVRKGDRITSYKSRDGKEWIPTASSTVSLNKRCYIGLVVSGGSEKPSTGMFRDVRVGRLWKP